MDEQAQVSDTPEAEFEKIFNELVSSPGGEEQPGSSTNAAGDPSDPAQSVPPSDGFDTDESAPFHEANDDTAVASNQEIDYKAELEKERQRTKSWEGRIRAANEARKLAEQKAAELEAKLTSPAKPVETQTPETEVEDPEVKEFFEAYPELMTPFNKLVQTKGAAIARQIIKEEMAKILPKVEELETTVKKTNDSAHFDTISKAHPGWESMVKEGKVQEWIDSQPSILQTELNRIMYHGSAQEAIELLDMFKQANTKQKQKPISKKAQDLMAVPSSKAQVPLGKPDPDDYDAAWREAIQNDRKN